MKTSTSLFLFSIAAFVISCHEASQPVEIDIQNATGTIVKKYPELYLIEADAPIVDRTKTIYPENLADSFKRDSLRVRFSGHIITPPPDPPYAYPSLKLSFIESI
jgi:hypothetical protein